MTLGRAPAHEVASRGAPAGAVLHRRGGGGARARGGRGARPRLVACALAAAVAAPAAAQEPTFTFRPPDAARAPGTVWSASAQLGLTSTTGNSESFGVGATAGASRRSGSTRLSAEARGGFARSEILVATESNGVPGIGPSEIDAIARTTTQAWQSKVRLDRYIGEKNSVYASAGAGGDRPAGRRLEAGGQVGYARALLLRAEHELTLELGYDLSHQDFVTAARAVTSHSGRLFLGWSAKPAASVGVRVSVDVLANLAAERSATREVDPLGHERVLGRAELDVKVNTKGSVGLRVRARYDTVPAPRPAFPGLAYEAGFTPVADRLDTSTELVFVYSIL